MRKELVNLGLVVVLSASVVLMPHSGFAAAPGQTLNGQPSGTRAPLTNAEVIQMVQAILASIRSRPAKFDLSPAALAALRQAGVSEAILNAMEQAQRLAQASGAPGSPTPPALQGNKPGQQPGKLRPEQRRALLSAKLSNTPGRLGQVVTNPQSNPATAELIALLRQQKQIALTEKNQARARSPNPNIALAPMGKPAVRLAAAPPSSSLASRAAPPSVTGAIQYNCPANGPPTILSVSGQQGSRAVFTQDPAFNPFTIKGCHFGDAKGQAQQNDVTGRKLTDLVVDTWTDNLITAEVPPSLTDLLDQGNVSLLLFPTNNAQARLAGFRFYALRREILLNSILPSRKVVQLVAVRDDSGQPVYPTFSSPYQGAGDDSKADAGWTAGVERNNVVRFVGGTDVFKFDDLKPGFVVKPFQVDKLSFAVCGSLGPTTTTDYTDGTWGWQMDGNSIRVTWQEDHCHDAYFGDDSNASYALKVWVEGPALSPGASPWQDGVH